MIEYDFKFGWNHYKFMVFRAKTEKTQIKANQNVLQNFGEKYLYWIKVNCLHP